MGRPDISAYLCIPIFNLWSLTEKISNIGFLPEVFYIHKIFKEFRAFTEFQTDLADPIWIQFWYFILTTE